MSNTDQLLFGTKSFGAKLRVMLDPMRQAFGINSISIVSIQDEVRLCAIHSNMAWAEHCFARNYHQANPSMVHPNRIGTGLGFWSSCKQPQFASGMLRDAVNVFDLCYGLTTVEKTTADSYIAYEFTSPAANQQFPNKVINNIQIINKFINYLRPKVRLMLDDLHNCKVDLVSVKGENFHNQDGMVCPLTPDSRNNKMQFLENISNINKHELAKITSTTLSRQEKRCIKLYAHGKTAEETANILQITRRTVEGYLENIKNKLNCSRKKDLLAKAEVLRHLEML